MISPMPGPPPRQHVYERQYTLSTHSVIPTRRIWNDDYDRQMIFGDLVGLKFPDIRLAGEENPEKTSPRKLVPTVDRTRARCLTSAHATTCSTAVDSHSPTFPSLHLRHSHSPTLPSLYLRHSSFSNTSVASPTSQLILQALFRFSYVTCSSPNATSRSAHEQDTVLVSLNCRSL